MGLVGFRVRHRVRLWVKIRDKCRFGVKSGFMVRVGAKFEEWLGLNIKAVRVERASTLG